MSGIVGEFSFVPVYSVLLSFLPACLSIDDLLTTEGYVGLLRECPLTRHYCVLGSGRISIIRSEIGHCGRRYTAHLLFSLISPIIVFFFRMRGRFIVSEGVFFSPHPSPWKREKNQKAFLFFGFFVREEPKIFASENHTFNISQRRDFVREGRAMDTYQKGWMSL